MRWSPAILLVCGCSEPTYYPYPAFTGGDAVDTSAPPDDTGTPDDLPCSVSGGGAVELTVVNETGTVGTMWWRDFDCVEHPYNAILSGTETVQSTFGGHSWALRDAVGGLLGAFVVGDAPEQTWVVP